MAAAMIYDTLKLAEQLEQEVGFDSARAKAMARILAENAGGNLATREDLLVAKGDLRAEMQSIKDELRAEMQAIKDELRAEIHALRCDLDAKISALDGKIRVLYWMTGTTLAGVAALLGTAIAIAVHIMRLG